MNRTNAILAGIVLLLMFGGAAFYFAKSTPSNQGANGNASAQRPLKTYYDPRYGIAFNFPDTYVVQDHDAASPVKHHTIVIGEKDALAQVPQNSEGPPVISIDIYDNPSRQTPENWIKKNDFSNYKLSQTATLATTTVAGIPAYAYPWDGLYQSTSIVFPDNGKMYMLSVNYNSTGDQIYKDFAGIVASVQFDQ